MSDSGTARINPFVKWPGGKRQLLDRLIENMPGEYNRYFEPFLGGGALLLAAQPKAATVNDINMQLINGYIQLRDNKDEVVKLLEQYNSAVCDKERYMDMRAKYNEKISAGAKDAETCALLIYINKTSFNGLYRCNRKGLLNVPFGNHEHASYDPDNLNALSEYLSQNDIVLLNGDFEKAVEDAEEGDFVYFDSPYLPESKTANFVSYAKDGFAMEDHERLAELCKALDDKGVKFMLSNNDVPLVHELYDRFDIESIAVRRSINRDASKRKGQEVIVKNY